ncbi:FERM domain-containing protein 6 isoform X2 [Hypomesus transpacificus]|uniref:FERM domain-containing protein 6 isoform X2 n=1 Tax=Hypomesus transpacificus TaxID=137520 RepID=UPI001F07BBC2|nr:FERM domain-containing protein 6 isoform X2 [Hypomesus transpacificus]
MSALAKKTVCVLLPNKEQLDITVGVKATGQDVFNRILELLGIKELHFFGLTVVRDNEHIFLDLEEKLIKYFPKEWKQDPAKGLKRSLPLLLCLKVQYYVENGRLICERKARRLYYSDLRERVLRSECRQQEEVYFQLAGYALQADLPDHVQDRGEQGDAAYFQPKEYFPPWIVAKRGVDYLLRHGPKVHGELRGMSARDATLHFIKESCRLEDVPVIFYRLQKDKREERGTALLGLTLKGMQVYQVNNIRELLFDFPWSNVGRLTFLGKKFEIQPDGLPSARKLVYYTGSPFRSRHLLLHLSSSHSLFLSLQPALTHLRHLEESEEKKRYRESYISDDLDLDPAGSEGSPGLSRNSTNSPGLSRNSTNSPGLSGHSTNSPGLSRNSTNSPGLSGHSTNSPGLSGHSTNSPGLSGHPTNSPGLSRNSTSSPGLSGHSTNSLGLSRNYTNSPGLSRNSTNSPGLSRNSTNSPGLSGHSTNSPGLSRNSNNSPGLSRNSTSSPGLSGHPTNSPSLSLHSTGSSGIEADPQQHNISMEIVSMEMASMEAEVGPKRAETCSREAASHGSSLNSSMETWSKDPNEEEEEGTRVSIRGSGEVSVDNPKETLRLAELLEGVSVDCPGMSSEVPWRGSEEVHVDSKDAVTLRNTDTLTQLKYRPSVSVDRHSQSLDNVCLLPPPAPLTTPLQRDSSHSYTCGLPNTPAPAYYLPLAIHCPPKPSFYGRRSTNCLSLDLLGDEQLLEFIL